MEKDTIQSTAQSTTTPTTDLLTLEEVIQWLKTSKTTIYRLVQRRQIPFYRIARSLRFKKEDVEAFIQERRVETIDRTTYGRS